MTTLCVTHEMGFAEDRGQPGDLLLWMAARSSTERTEAFHNPQSDRTKLFSQSDSCPPNALPCV